MPASVSLSDSTATLVITVVVTNPGEQAISFETGGPPFRIVSDPSQSRGLAASARIASGADPLNAGPGMDTWEGPEVTFVPHGRKTWEYEVSVRAWRAGAWAVEPGMYRVRTYYNGQEGQPRTFGVTP
jgi:hypothetical protein